MDKEYLNIELSLDGDMWCASVGPNLQEGLAGFGASPLEAIKALCDEIEINQWNLPTMTLFYWL